MDYMSMFFLDLGHDTSSESERVIKSRKLNIDDGIVERSCRITGNYRSVRIECFRNSEASPIVFQMIHEISSKEPLMVDWLSFHTCPNLHVKDTIQHVNTIDNGVAVSITVAENVEITKRINYVLQHVMDIIKNSRINGLTIQNAPSTTLRRLCLIISGEANGVSKRDILISSGASPSTIDRILGCLMGIGMISKFTIEGNDKYYWNTKKELLLKHLAFFVELLSTLRNQKAVLASSIESAEAFLKSSIIGKESDGGNSGVD